ncbi:MAG: DNA double-strand break repair nuclease NurA [Aigarchaeota archaeon]|nr:DNA double-strand break repair nuclease NurA [Candidatus Pelearchaeum maunauluense]
MMQTQLAHQPYHHNQLEQLLKAFSRLSPAMAGGLGGGELIAPETLIEPEEEELEPHLSLDGLKPIPLKVSEEPRRVIAVDTSTVKLAEGVNGSIWALRGVVVKRVLSTVELEIFGPIIYQLSKQTLPLIMKTLTSSLGLQGHATPRLEMAHSVVASLFEKMLQLYAASQLDGGILLIDGSLTAGPIDSPLRAVRMVIQVAQQNGIGVVAFAKSSKLRYMGVKITNLLNGSKPPYLVCFKDALRLRPGHYQLGEIYVAHLSRCLFPYRVDVAARDCDEPYRAVEDLLASDSLVYGYPETLILAHQYATFNKTDILGLQVGLENLTGSRIINIPDVRQALFSPLDAS